LLAAAVVVGMPLAVAVQVVIVVLLLAKVAAVELLLNQQ
jgi:hypothetical protein